MSSLSGERSEGGGLDDDIFSKHREWGKYSNGDEVGIGEGETGRGKNSPLSLHLSLPR